MARQNTSVGSRRDQSASKEFRTETQPAHPLISRFIARPPIARIVSHGRTRFRLATTRKRRVAILHPLPPPAGHRKTPLRKYDVFYRIDFDQSTENKKSVNLDVRYTEIVRYVIGRTNHTV